MYLCHRDNYLIKNKYPNKKINIKSKIAFKNTNNKLDQLYKILMIISLKI